MTTLKFIFQIGASDFADFLRRVAQHARRFLCAAQTSGAVGKNVHARGANFGDEIYISSVTEVLDTICSEKNQAFCTESRRQMD